MVQFRTLLILFVISFGFILITYAKTEDEFAVKSHHARSGRGSGSDSGYHGLHRHTRTISIPVLHDHVIQRRMLGYSGLGYGGVRYSRLGYRGLGYSGLGYMGVGYRGLGYGGYYGWYCLWLVVDTDMVVIDMDTKFMITS